MVARVEIVFAAEKGGLFEDVPEGEVAVFFLAGIMKKSSNLAGSSHFRIRRVTITFFVTLTLSRSFAQYGWPIAAQGARVTILKMFENY